MESDISVRPTETTRPVEVAFKADPEYSDRTKPKWFVPFDVPTEIFGQGKGGLNREGGSISFRNDDGVKNKTL